MGERSAVSSQGQIDGAALGSGVVGVAVAMLMQPGAYTGIAAIVALTLGLVIIGFMGGHTRTPIQSAGFGAVMGVLMMPVVGTILERSEDATATTVSNWLLYVTWAIVGIASAAIDQWRQRKIVRIDHVGDRG